MPSLLAAGGFFRADHVGECGDRDGDAGDAFASCAAAEVVVAGGAGGREHEVDVAGGS